jgi:hypothetical protein
VSKNLAKFHKDHVYDDDYEGFGTKFEKNRKKLGESVEVNRTRGKTTTRFKPKNTKNYGYEEDFYYE